jgi:mono/diheme cytochrome c family protein
MYVESEAEIREWILYGHPKRLEKDHAHPGPLLEMPAFEGVISSSDLEDLVAYYKVVAAYDNVPPAPSAGRSVASRSGCFGCHGPGGLVGGSNPRSFKGYVPPWRGADYRELVKNEAELRQWIREGQIDRFTSNPIARFSTDRQVIQMPAYEDRLSDGEVDDLVHYIEWLQDGARQVSRSGG